MRSVGLESVFVEAQCSRSPSHAREPLVDVVQKFSGTDRHFTPNADLLSLTVYALAHFVLIHTAGEYCLADLQGTPGRVNDKDGFILFDLMTHTMSGKSGLGDFGVKGIKTFMAEHECKDVCQRLKLDEYGMPTLAKPKPTSTRKNPKNPERRSSRLRAAEDALEATVSDDGEEDEGPVAKGLETGVPGDENGDE